MVKVKSRLQEHPGGQFRVLLAASWDVPSKHSIPLPPKNPPLERRHEKQLIILPAAPAERYGTRETSRMRIPCPRALGWGSGSSLRESVQGG